MFYDAILWRDLFTGFSSAANFLAFSIVTNFMWPSKMSYHFLTHPNDPNNDFSDELEDYDRDASEHFNYYNNPNYTQPNSDNDQNNGSSRRHNQNRPFSHPFSDPNHLKTWLIQSLINDLSDAFNNSLRKLLQRIIIIDTLQLYLIEI